jgi:hypothetical protein
VVRELSARPEDWHPDHPYVLNDQADEGNDDAPVRRVESDRRLDGRQVVVEAARADSKELGKESESTASEGLDGHWDHWNHREKEAERRRDGETDRRREDAMMGMRVKIIEGKQTYIQSTVERDTNPVVVVVLRDGEAIRQKV